MILCVLTNKAYLESEGGVSYQLVIEVWRTVQGRERILVLLDLGNKGVETNWRLVLCFSVPSSF